jgi:hypothetical protein
MINLAKPFMAKSSVVDSKTGKSTESRFVFVFFVMVPIISQIIFFHIHFLERPVSSGNASL